MRETFIFSDNSSALKELHSKSRKLVQVVVWRKSLNALSRFSGKISDLRNPALMLLLIVNSIESTIIASIAEGSQLSVMFCFFRHFKFSLFYLCLQIIFIGPNTKRRLTIFEATTLCSIIKCPQQVSYR